jgi:hypothetical protein
VLFQPPRPRAETLRPPGFMGRNTRCPSFQFSITPSLDDSDRQQGQGSTFEGLFNSFSDGHADSRGAVFGGQVGCDYQVCSWVFGVQDMGI